MNAVARKTIGVLGGMGPEATRDFYDRIIRRTPAARDQDHLKVIILSDPQIPDRTAAIVAGGEDPVPAMLAGLRTLAAAGADFIVIPCISAHYFLDRLRATSPLPILSAFDAVADAILATAVRRVGMLATDGTIRGGRFECALAARGIAVVAPDPAAQREVMSAIYAIKSDPQGRRRDACRARLQAAAARLVERGAEGIVAGCTEVPLALGPSDRAVPFFDSLDILAAAAVAAACRP